MNPILEEYLQKINKTRFWLALSSVVLVFFSIILFNLNVLPIQKINDFGFFFIIFLIFALYRPGWSFLLFIGTIPLEIISIAPDAIGMTVRPYQFLGATTFIAFIVRFLMSRLNFNLPKFNKVFYLLLIFSVSGFMSALVSLDKIQSFKLSVIAVSFVILYLLARVFIQNFEDLKKISPFFLGSGIIVFLYGVWQNFRFEGGLEAFEVMPGRPNATFSEADWLGIFIGLFLAALYSVVFYFQKKFGKRFSRSGFLRNFGLFFAVSLSFTLLIISVSRSAWLGSLIVTGLFLVVALTDMEINPKKWQVSFFGRHVLLIGGAVAVSFLLINILNLTSFEIINRAESTTSGLQEITVSCREEISLPEKIESQSELEGIGCSHIKLEEIDSEEEKGNFVGTIMRSDPNVDIRREVYSKSWETIKMNPVFGVGWGSIGKILGQDESGTTLNSSNIFFEIWLGAGIFGLISFLLICFYILIKSWKLLLKTEDEEKTIGLFVFLGLFAIIVPNLFNAGIFLAFLWVFLGASVSLVNENRN